MLLRIFVLTFFVVVAHSKEIVEVQYSRAVEGEIEECSFMYKEYPGKYLRGVRENSYSIWYNNTSLDACKRLCCFAEDDCLSFSYFKALEICFIMNVTKDHETATIINVSSWVHFQKVFGYDYTTTSYDYETTPLPTTPFRISPGVIPGKNKPDKYAEKPNQGASMPNTSSFPKSNPSSSITESFSTPKTPIPHNTNEPRKSTNRVVTTKSLSHPTTRKIISQTSNQPTDEAATTDAEKTIHIEPQSTPAIDKSTLIDADAIREMPQYDDDATTPDTLFDATALYEATTAKVKTYPFFNDPTYPDPSVLPHATGDNIDESTTASSIIASAKSDTKPSHSSTTTPHASSTTVGEEAPDNILDGGSFGGSKSEPILGGKGPEEEEGSGQFTGSPGRPTNSQICPLKCENGGRCERVLINHSQHAVVPFRCLCLEGFYGSNCELQMEKYASSGPADYVIALVCLAIIIVILFVAVLIAFYFNRHKTGKYRVRKEKERWNRKRKMRGNQHFIPSPMGSLATSEGSVRSGSDRSTATLV